MEDLSFFEDDIEDLDDEEFFDEIFDELEGEIRRTLGYQSEYRQDPLLMYSDAKFRYLILRYR